MKQKLQKEFSTTDLALCATLCCLGYEIKEIDNTDPRRVNFTILADEKIDDLIRKFHAHELKVDALSFFNYLKEVKTRIYNYR
jgi:hypothetical protein